jgi:hypothetical protein
MFITPVDQLDVMRCAFSRAGFYTDPGNLKWRTRENVGLPAPPGFM